MNGRLYALITTHCNLSCSYCDVKNCAEQFNRDEFINQLNNFDGRIILFGGEPTLYPDRLIDIYLSNPEINRKISSISTNLIYLDDKILSILQLVHYVCTSWNPSRFNENEYKKWLDNINLISERTPNISLRILVTMTDDLLKLSSDEFNNIINNWNSNIIKDIRFEHYIGDESDEEYFTKCDEWLCEIYKSWNSPIRMSNINEINNWYFDCSDVYTLYPDGTIKKGCPHSSNISVPLKCYECDRSDICKPCQLQRYCSYPYKFAQLVNSINKEEV